MCTTTTVTLLGNLPLCLTNDLIACAQVVNVVPGITTPVSGTTVGATIDAAPTCVTALNTAPGVWYKFFGTGNPITISACGSGFDTKLGIFSDATLLQASCITGNDDFCGVQSQVTVNSVLAEDYWVLITGFGTASGNFDLRFTSPRPDVRIAETAMIFASIQAAYDAALNGQTIQMRDAMYAENLILHHLFFAISVTLKGGYDASFVTITGPTDVTGSLTISNGTAVIDNLVIQ